MEKLLTLEPGSKLVQQELNNLEKTIENRQLVFPIKKKEEEKSKKPLRRVQIEEINDDSKAEIEKNLSQVNRSIQLTQKEEKLFAVKSENEKIEKSEIKIAETKPILEKKLEKTIPNEIKPFPENKPARLPKTIPEAPTNSFQFKKDWQYLSDNLDTLATYLKVRFKYY